MGKAAETATRRSTMDRVLDFVERNGNRVPHPAVIFLIMIGIVILASVIFAGVGVTVETIDPVTDQVVRTPVEIRSLLTADGIRFLLTSWVPNFMAFSATGMILVAMLGVGVAEQAGLVNALIRKIVLTAPRRLITFIIVLMGGLSSIAADAGYVVLIPLGAIAFLSLGRHPLAGIAAAFAGVSAIFAVNILITPLDGVLTEITNDAIHLLEPTKSLDLMATFFFSSVSLILFSALCAWVTERFVEPHLGAYTGDVEVVPAEELKPEEQRGLRNAGIALLLFTAFVLLLTVPSWGPLRNPETGEVFGSSPFMDGLIVLIALLFLAVGWAYGKAVGTVKNASDAIGMIDKAFSGMGPLIFLFLVIAQFLAFFNYTNIATILAVNLAEWLVHLNLGSITLLIGFTLAIMLLDFIMPGAIPKWAIFAPIFVPLFMQLGTAPETVLAAYRVGDSPINVITPLMGYFPLVVIYCQQYQKEAGVGTVVALMLPYTIALVLTWIPFLVAWYALGIPFGP